MSIRAGIPWGLIVHVIDRLLTVGKRGHLRISKYDRALIDQDLYAFGGLFFRGICIIERPTTIGGFQPFKMYIVFNNNTKAGKSLVGSRRALDTRSQREAGKLIVRAPEGKRFKTASGATDGKLGMMCLG